MKPITSLNEQELIDLMIEMNQPKFRGKQLFEWLHKHNARSYDDMKNIPKILREQLEERFPLNSSDIDSKHVSNDGTIRYLLKLDDGNLVETVAITNDSKHRNDPNDEDIDELAIQDNKQSQVTVCVSSQVGCPMLCAFCATGQEGFTRNLSVDEIVDQVVFITKDTGCRASNVVVMGQGEPFNNYDAVIESIRRLNSDPGLNIGARHITVSTCGIIKGIERFSNEPEQFRLAISLHSAVQATRNLIMPKLASQTLSQLKTALIEYDRKKGRRITLEYLLLNEINDSEKELDALIAFCEGLNVHVNLLHYNPTEDGFFDASPEKTFDHWQKVLNSNGIKCTARKSRGADISAACGQLKNARTRNL